MTDPSATEQIPAVRNSWLAAPVPFLFALTCTLICQQVAGDGLGLFFGGVATATLLAPPLALSPTRLTERALAASAVCLGIVLIWLVPTVRGEIALSEWLTAFAILAIYIAALAGLAGLLHRLGLPAVAASAVTIILALAWLSWPIWLTVWLRGDNRQTIVAWLVAPHPLLTLNGALIKSLPVPWAQHRIAYAITSIGQDIPYTLPATIWPTLGLHGLIAVATWSFQLPKARASHRV